MARGRQDDPPAQNQQTREYNFSIDNFYGDANNINWFSDQIKELKKLNNWSDQAALFYLKSKLKGSAQSFFASSPACQKVQTLQEALDILKDFFGEQTSSSVHINKFNNISILPQESVRNLAHRIETAAHSAYNFIQNEEALNKIKSIQFINALPKQFHADLLFENPSEFHKIVQKAITLESFSSHKSAENLNAVAITSHNSPPVVSNEFELLKEQMSSLTVAVTTALSQCPFCNKSHNLRNCSEFLNLTKGSRDQSPMTCNFCNKKGHTMSRCRLYQSTRSNNFQTNGNRQEFRNHLPNRGQNRFQNRDGDRQHVPHQDQQQNTLN